MTLPPKDSPPSTHKEEISGPLGAKDDDSMLKEELSKAYKRIADLETRVHDLTLQSTMVRGRGEGDGGRGEGRERRGEEKGNSMYFCHA